MTEKDIDRQDFETLKNLASLSHDFEYAVKKQLAKDHKLIQTNKAVTTDDVKTRRTLTRTLLNLSGKEPETYATRALLNIRIRDTFLGAALRTTSKEYLSRFAPDELFTHKNADILNKYSTENTNLEKIIRYKISGPA